MRYVDLLTFRAVGIYLLFALGVKIVLLAAFKNQGSRSKCRAQAGGCPKIVSQGENAKEQRFIL